MYRTGQDTRRRGRLGERGRARSRRRSRGRGRCRCRLSIHFNLAERDHAGHASRQALPFVGSFESTRVLAFVRLISWTISVPSSASFATCQSSASSSSSSSSKYTDRGKQNDGLKYLRSSGGSISFCYSPSQVHLVFGNPPCLRHATACRRSVPENHGRFRHSAHEIERECLGSCFPSVWRLAGTFAPTSALGWRLPRRPEPPLLRTGSPPPS